MNNSGTITETVSDLPSAKTLFWGFFKIGMIGFGGVAVSAHHVIVNERRWMDDREYAALLGFGQILPGGTIINIAVMFGSRCAGLLGVLAALFGLFLVPLSLLLGVATLYAGYGNTPLIHHAITAMAAVAGGMLIGTGIKNLRRVRLDKRGMVIFVLAFAAILIAHIPLGVVLLVMLPLSIAIMWPWRRS